MQKLVQGLHKFRSEIFQSHQDLYGALAKGQHPEALFITCSDSRVNPNLITQTQPGDLFILRNAGNIIPPHGAVNGSEAATIEFAVAGLGVRHIVVCGHTLCGAMRGLIEPQCLESMPAVQAWLANAEVTRRVIRDSYGHLEGPAQLTITVEENVLAQIENLRTHPSIKDGVTRGQLALYAWVYKIETGEVFQYEHERGQFERIAETAGASAIPETHVKRRSI
jgi:carbonic anhydrase